MALSCEGVELNLICDNWSNDYQLGHMRLPIPFILEYGDVLPTEIQLRIPNGNSWSAVFVRGSDYLQGLEKMMQFYGIRPYHLMKLYYVGGRNFHVQIFNECAVEISYPSVHSERNVVIRSEENIDFLETAEIQCTPIEIEKLKTTLWYNAMTNFCSLCDLLVSENHVESKNNYQIFSVDACKKLHISEELQTLTFCLETSLWKIKCSWKNGFLFLDSKWYEFVHEANIGVGDTCIFLGTKTSGTYKVAILPEQLSSNYCGFRDVKNHQGSSSFFKIMNKFCIHNGQLEVPKLFCFKFGEELDKIIHLNLQNGKEYIATFDLLSRSISGLHRLFRKVSMYAECVIIFNYMGESKFEVSVYDSLGMDLLKHITGDFITEEDIQIDSDLEIIVISDTTESTDSDNSDTSSETDEDREPNQEEAIPMMQGVEVFSFIVTLKQSHVNQSGHGVYCSSEWFHLYKYWNNETILTLAYEVHEYEVQVLRRGRTCRFGKGWDVFNKRNNLQQGQMLRFVYYFPFTFDVTLVI